MRPNRLEGVQVTRGADEMSNILHAIHKRLAVGASVAARSSRQLLSRAARQIYEERSRIANDKRPER